MGRRSGATGCEADPAEPVLSATDVEYSYGQVQVLFGVDLSLGRGEILALLGTNGAGKSTVLRVMAGLETPSGGRVSLDGVDITGAPAEELCHRGLGMVIGGRGVFADMTVKENLELGGFTLPAARLSERIQRELSRFPRLGVRLYQAAGALSGGEQQQLAIAKALLLDPRVLFIDELSLGLAPAMVAELFGIVREVNRSGVSCILVEQSLTVAAELCDRAVFLEKGRVRFEGDVGELLERGDLARAVFLGDHPPVPVGEGSPR